MAPTTSATSTPTIIKSVAASAITTFTHKTKKKLRPVKKMEVPLSNSKSIVVHPKVLTELFERMGDLVAWADSPSDLKYTLSKYLQQTYKRLQKSDQFTRISPWHSECLVLLSNNGLSIDATLLTRAISAQKGRGKTTSEHDYSGLKTYLVASLHVSKLSQLADPIMKHLGTGDLENIQVCIDALADSLNDSDDSVKMQTLRRLVWGVVVSSAVVNCTVSQTRDRLMKRCESTLTMLKRMKEA